ncbi:MAG TPA: transcriptional regulator GcvA [Alphaproteobacteria bacterium]|nr:transcriptional regulator GcvA [Alphaproteobacteria bacterium]
MLRLPPLNALRVFEAAARHASFKRAAEELCVTQGAVSRHVQKLEGDLGAKLFARHHRQVRLTTEGTEYLAIVRDALGRISQATNSLRSRGEERMLKVKLPITCAVRWLVPRLARFHGLHPEISVQITTSHDRVDFRREDIDVAIHYGHRADKGLASETLFNEVLLPICSPKLLRRPPPLRSPRDLAHHVLLHSIRRPDDWRQWLTAAHASDVEGEHSLIFENSSLTYQGVTDGLGLAVAQLAFAADDLASGHLIAPFDIRVRNHLAYMLVFPAERAATQKIRRFRDWITAEAEATQRAIAA